MFAVGQSDDDADDDDDGSDDGGSDHGGDTDGDSDDGGDADGGSGDEDNSYDDDNEGEDEDDGDLETGIGFVTSGAFSPEKGLGVGIGFIGVEVARRLVERSRKADLSVFESETVGGESNTSDLDEERRVEVITTIPLLAGMRCPNSTVLRPVILYIAP